jgi:predicted O-methyltransferase YrrM
VTTLLSARLRYLRRRTAQARCFLDGQGELAKLMGRYPDLAGIELSLPQARAELAALRHGYFSTVSMESMALSLESAALVTVLCRSLKPKRVVDLGSGFSSLVIRLAAPDAQLFSVDHSSWWLDATRRYLEANDVDSDGLFTWDEFRSSGETDFDLVIHDMGSTFTLRGEVLPEVLQLPRLGGWLLIDDLQVSQYRAKVKNAVRTGFEVYRLSQETMDWHLRHAWLVKRSGSVQP